MINKPILFNIIGIHKQKTSYADGQQILVRSISRPKWSCIPKELTFYYKSSRHQAYTNQVLTFIFTFDKIEDTYISSGYPYNYSMLNAYLNKIEEKNLQYFHKLSLGLTYNKNQLFLLQIGNQNSKHKIFISARCHPGEFPGSYICHGIIQYLISRNKESQFLINNLLFYIVPMINPDGVVDGNYRVNSKGYDLNRCFNLPDDQIPIEAQLIRNFIIQQLGQKRDDILTSFETQETNQNLIKIAQKLKLLNQSQKLNQKPQQQVELEIQERQKFKEQPNYLDFIIDLHSHSNISGGFVFTNPDNYVTKQVEKQAIELVFPILLSQNCATFGVIEQSFKQSQGKREGSIRRHFNLLGKQYQLDAGPHVYCIEVSNNQGPDPRLSINQMPTIQGQSEESTDFKIKSTIPNIKYTPDEYLQIGYKICETLFQIYNLSIL